METISQPIAFLLRVAELAFDVKDIVKLFMLFMLPAVATWGVIKYFFGQTEGKLDLNKYVFYPLIMVFLLSQYSYMIDITSKLVVIFDDAMGDNWEKYQVMLDKAMHLEDEKTFGQMADEASQKAGTYSGSGSQYNSGSAMFQWVGQGISKGWSSITKSFKVSYMYGARSILELVRDFVLSFLIIVGPLAILIDIVPIFRGVFKHWFKQYIAVLMWIVSIDILDSFVLAVDELNDGFTIFHNIVFILMYIMVPYLTSLYIGTQAAGIFMSKAVGVGTAMLAKGVSAGAGMATGGASAAAGSIAKVK
jgi:uncharacterized membrane protein